MAGSKADLPFTLRGHRSVAIRRRGRAKTIQRPISEAERQRRDELAESMAAAEEIAEILAAQAGDDVVYYRRQANQIVGFMLNGGWSILKRRPA